MKKIYDIEKLKEAYSKCVAYLEAHRQFKKLEKDLKEKASNFETEAKKKYRVAEIEQEKEMIEKEIKNTESVESAYEKYWNKKISITELERILKIKKDFIEISQKLEEANNMVKNETDQFIASLKTKKYEFSKRLAIKKGMETICLNPHEWLGVSEADIPPYKDYDKDSRRCIQDFRKLFLSNKFGDDENVNNIGNFVMTKEWFAGHSAPVTFEDEKIIEDLPSPFEYYLSKLNMIYDEDLEKVTIVTNDLNTTFTHNNWESEYHHTVFVATLFAPRNVAARLRKTEKAQTKSTIKRLIEECPDIFVLQATDYEYANNHQPDYKYEFNETLRNDIRKKCFKYSPCVDAKGFENCINLKNFCEEFGYRKNGGLNVGLSGQDIIKVPSSEVAKAIFDTLKFVNKLYELKDKNLKNKETKFNSAKFEKTL